MVLGNEMLQRRFLKMGRALADRAKIFLVLFLTSHMCTCSEKQVLKTCSISPSTVCLDSQAHDQDDMCAWVHPFDSALSTIITADKKAHMLFVYDLDGHTIQSIPVRSPGNIDIRYNFLIGGQKEDIVVFNERSDIGGGGTSFIRVYTVNSLNRKLKKIDGDSLAIEDSYGSALYHSLKNKKFYLIQTSKTGIIRQHELFDANGKIGAKQVRQWALSGVCEALVADDEHSKLYISEESKGVWKFDAEPDAGTSGELIAKVSENGLVEDVEGVAVYDLPNGQGYILVSNQGNSTFNVYERASPHKCLGSFCIAGASKTDGIEVINIKLNEKYPSGLFACHSHTGPDNKRCPVYLVNWKSIAECFSPKLHYYQ